MNQINDKEQWIDQVLKSTTGKQKVDPPDGLFEKILKDMSPRQATVRRIDRMMALAAAVLLFVLNGLAVQSYINNANNADSQSSGVEILSDYNLYDYE